MAPLVNFLGAAAKLPAVEGFGRISRLKILLNSARTFSWTRSVIRKMRLMLAFSVGCADAPEETQVVLLRAELAVGNILPCVRIQDDVRGRIVAMAVDVDRVGVVLSTVVRPVHRPGAHVAPVGVLLQLRAARTIAQEIADRVGFRCWSAGSARQRSGSSYRRRCPSQTGWRRRCGSRPPACRSRGSAAPGIAR